MGRSGKFKRPIGVTLFNRGSFSGKEKFTCIGNGSLGAKALGLAKVKKLLEKEIAPAFEPAIVVAIPLMTIITTESFDRFVKENSLYDALSPSLADEDVIRAFESAALPADLTFDLAAFVAHIRTPLAVRPSSLIEETASTPLARIYCARFVPNNNDDPSLRLKRLCDAVKYVYASAFFKKSRGHLKAVNRSPRDEKLAVIIQEVVGTHGEGRYYPAVSGVARSLNYYPLGLARPDDGCVSLALGLGKTIIDEGVGWTYSPACPHANPPYNSPGDLLEQAQTHFWAIGMESIPGSNSFDKNQHMKRYSLSDAIRDGTLVFIASTFQAENERIVMGIDSPGPKVVDFGHLLKTDLIPFNQLMKELLKRCQDLFVSAVEMEFAMTFPYPKATPARFALLQVRPMSVTRAQVDVSPDELLSENVLLASESTLGNAVIETIRDIVYLKPRAFDASRTREAVSDIEAINRNLISKKVHYVLIGFGRWGTSDPSAGIPVNFEQISGASVIVESTLAQMNFFLSQGAHLFHDIIRLKVLYFSVSHTSKQRIDWEWLDGQEASSETELVRHVRLESPLMVKVDGRSGRGVIIR